MGLAALPLGADAAQVQSVTFQQNNWQGTGLNIENGLIMSTGAEVTYNIPELMPGNYVLTGQLTTRLYPVKITIAGVEWTSGTGDNAQDIGDQGQGISFTLSATTDVTLSLVTTGKENTIGAGAEFTLGSPMLKLDFDFATAKNKLLDAANEAKTTIQGYTYGNSTELATINSYINTINGITESYTSYKNQELYLVADDKSTIQKNIQTLLQTASQKQATYDEEQRVAANTAQYNAVNSQILTAKGYYSSAANDINDLLKEGEVPYYLKEYATTELNNLNLLISTALTTNLQKKNQYASQGVYTDADAQAIIATIPTEAQFQAVVTKYTNLANDAKAAYDALTAQVTTLQTNLDAVVINGNVSEQFTQQKQAAQDAITAIDNRVKAIKGVSDPALLDITADYNAAQALITALQNDANEANAEFDANALTLAAIAGIQDQLDDAMAVIEGKKYGTVSVSSKWTAITDGLQAQIDALTADARTAYTNGTARDYNTNLDTADLEDAIADYATKSLAAYNRYVLLAPVFEENKAKIDALRTEYNGNKAIYDTDKTGRDYKYNLDILLRDINTIDDDLQAAVAKSGDDHYNAIMAISGYEDLPTRLKAEETAMACCTNDYNAQAIFTDGSGKDLQGKINTFRNTYTAANTGDYYQGLKDREDAIETALGAIQTTIAATNTYSETVASNDYTNLVGKDADSWTVSSGNNSNKGTITPNGVTMIEHYGESGVGTMISQEISGLENGIYNVELYALSHNARGEDGANLQTSSWEVAHVFAQSGDAPAVTTPILARKNQAAEADEPVAYLLENVEVVDGKLNIGLAIDMAGMCGWHAIQIKSLTGIATTASRIESWKDKIAELDEQQTQLESEATPVKTAVTTAQTTKSGLTGNINTLQNSLNTFETTYGYENDNNKKLGLRKDATFVKEQAIEDELEALAEAVAAVSDTNLSGNFTDKVGETNNDWIVGSIANNSTLDGNKKVIGGVTFIEHWSSGQSGNVGKTGTLLTQTVDELPNGVYNLEVYTFASVGSNVQVNANGKTKPAPATGEVAETVVLDNIQVTDGTLTISLEKLAGGSSWHGIQIKSLTGVYTDANKTKLDELAVTYNGLNDRKAALDTEASQIATEVKANADAYKYIYQFNTSSSAYYNNNLVYLGTYETSTLKNLGNDNSYGKITDGNGDYNATGAYRNDPTDWYIFQSGLANDATYTARKAAIDADIEAMKDAVQASYEAETLVADYQNGTIGNYSVATIKAAIDQLKADVATEKANWDAYKTTKMQGATSSDKNYWNNLNTELATANNGLAAAAGDAADHYNALYNDYATQTATLLTNITASLNGRTMAADKAGYVTAITQLRTKVNGLVSAASANLAKYNQQTEDWLTTQTAWNNAYTTISSREVSYTAQQGYLNQLNVIQGEIDQAILNAEHYFKAGEAVEKASEIDFAGIQGRISDLVAQEDADYIPAVAADNLAHHEAFTTELGLATSALDDAKAEIQKNSSSNPDIAAALYNIISDYINALNVYEEQLATIAANEGTAYASVESPASYTEGQVQTFVGQANAVKANIVNTKNAFKEAVKKEVTSLWTAKVDDYNAQVTAAKQQIASYSAEAKQNAFKTVEDEIAAGNAAATLEAVEAALNSLADIDDQIADCINEAAKKDLEPRFAAIDVDADRAAVAAYGEYAPNTFESTVTDYYTAAETRFNDSYEAGTLAGNNRSWIINMLNQYTNRVRNILAQAEINKQADEANTAAYNDMVAATNAWKAKLATAKEKNAQFVFSTYDFASCDQAVANQEEANEDAKTGGYAVDDKDWTVNTYIPMMEQEVLSTLNGAFGQERDGLGTTIAELKNLWNEYVAAHGLDATAQEYQATINSSERVVNQTQTLNGLTFDAAFDACDAIIAAQNAIAELETAMNAEANSQALTTLTSKIEELRAGATLEGKDEWIGQQDWKYGKTVAEGIDDINDRIDAVEKDIAAEENLAFYKGRFQQKLEEIETDLGSVTSKISTLQAQVDADQQAYNDYTGIMTGLSDRAAAARERVKRYSGHDYRTSYINQAESDITDVNAELKRRHELKVTQAFQLNGYSFGWYNKSISDNIDNYLEYRASDELFAQTEQLETNLANAINDGSDTSKYSQALWNNLVDQEAEIDAQITALSDAIDASTDPDADYEALMETVRKIQDAIDVLTNTVANMNLLNGDANMDKKVDVLDYQTVSNWILKPESQPASDANAFLLADVNTNETIDVGDLAGVVNIIMGRQWNVAAARGMNVEMESESVDMAVSMTENGTQRIAISLDNVHDYTAFQLDLVLPEGMSIVNKDLTDRAADSHSLLCRKQLDGSVRFLASSIKGETFKGTKGDVLVIEVQTSDAYAGGDVQVTNIIFSQPSSQIRAFAIGGDATGIETASVLDTLKQQVYNLGGKLMNGIRKGVNIIRRADGTVEKKVSK